MKLLISHPTGNQNVRAAAVSFARMGIATSFHTTIATFSGDALDCLSDLKVFSALRRRRYDNSLRSITKTSPWLEMARLVSLRAGFHYLTNRERSMFSTDSVYRDLDRRVANTLRYRSAHGTSAVYAYEDGALSSFRKARELGLQCFYDLPIGYWRAGRAIMETERERRPEWQSTMGGLFDSAEKLARKDEEIRLADKVYVASQYTASTLRQFPGVLPPIEVIPYGFPPVAKDRIFSVADGRGPLKILFVGSLTQRKGIADLFAVVESLRRHVKLTVVGSETNNDCSVLRKELSKHHWIRTLPNKDVLHLMQMHDVLVFPTLFEGFGLVITEAMSQGTPVITTDRTVGPDLIKDGVNGWIIKAGSHEALHAAIEKILQNRKAIASCGRAAMETARLRPWEVYGRELAESVQKEMMSSVPDR